jgi:hypothetical protein
MDKKYISAQPPLEWENYEPGIETQNPKVHLQ